MQSNYIPLMGRNLYIWWVLAWFVIYTICICSFSLWKSIGGTFPVSASISPTAPGGVERGFDIVVSVFVIAVIGDLLWESDSSHYACYVYIESSKTKYQKISYNDI